MKRWAAVIGTLALLAVNSALQPSSAQVRTPDTMHEHDMHEPALHEPAMHEHGPVMAGDPNRKQGFVPGLGEIMAAQQVRHAKLWFAGSAANWPLAAYEVDELVEGFEQVATLHPMHDGVDVAKLLPLTIARPLAELAAAIRAQEPARFRERYDQLTAACNACHQAAHHGFIVIQRPSAPPFTNQVYTPPQP